MIKSHLFKFVRLLSCMNRLHFASIMQSKFYALKSEWIAAKMAEAGSNVCFQKIGLLHNPANIFLGSNINFGTEVWLSTWMWGGKCQY